MRIIKPTFWNSEPVASISLQAGLLFISLWNHADDYGVLLDSSRLILGLSFGLRSDVELDDVERWLGEIESVGLIIRVRRNNHNLIIISGFNEHQVINRRGKPQFIGMDQINDILTEYKKDVNVSINTTDEMISDTFSEGISEGISESLTEPCNQTEDTLTATCTKSECEELGVGSRELGVGSGESGGGSGDLGTVAIAPENPLSRYPLLEKHMPVFAKQISVLHAKGRNRTKLQQTEDADTLAKLCRIDKNPEQKIVDVLTWLCDSSHRDAQFWRIQVQCLSGLRKVSDVNGMKKYEQIELRYDMATGARQSSGKPTPELPRMEEIEL